MCIRDSIYALFLLAQFRETQAYPLIIEFFSTPGDSSLDVTGDMVTEYLARILATVWDGNTEPLKKLIENSQVNEFVVGAALDSLLVLVAQEIISRESVIDYFRELFETRLEKESNSDTEPDYFLSNLTISSAQLYPLELKPQIERAFELDLIDGMYINPKDIEYYLKLGLDANLNKLRSDRHFSLIEDTIAELEWWYCFQEQKEKPARKKPIGLGSPNLSSPKKSNQSKKKAKRKMQKQARRKNRSKKK